MGSSGTTLVEIEDLYRRRGRDFYRLVLARTGDSALAQDAVQEGFARAIRARASFRASGPLDAWICRCILNAAHDAASQQPRGDVLEEPVEVTVTDASSEPELRRALRTLPPRQRDALFLRFYLDFDYATIAEILGVEIGTVSATLHTARNTLAQALEEVVR